ncbi:putative bifunctional diguanylate cyclase/phosphodiesterase [Massilia sp. DWR3-1-1]|uniref:putative bifunctional diguanylate cyclase/phosphodiesterase n=1 Tax=Massilia sp. DWR3-1-1 TaxID=2804559 RepID=UPI003CEE4D5D
MNIAAFIRQSMHTILDEWEVFAQSIPIANALSRFALRDHAAGILVAIADDLDQVQSAYQEEQKSTGHGPVATSSSHARQHGSDRVVEGFSVNDAMSEYRALRASVVRQWVQHQSEAQTPVFMELVRFNEAIDQALTESLYGYSDDRDRRARLYDTLLSASPDLSFIVDRDGRVEYGNAALAAEFGEPLSVLRGKRLSEINGFTHEQFDEHVRLVSRSQRTTLGEISRTRRGKNVTFEYLLVPVVDHAGKFEAVAGIARNVTDRKAAEEKYRRSAQYDDLTGLPSRLLFRDRLSHEIKRADRIHLPLALMFVDLDGFKQVNDLLGHEAGDELLQQGARRIRDCVRQTDTVARLGGDEFTVIFTEIRSMPHIGVLAQQILDALAREFSIAGRSVMISASLGIALYPNDARAQDELLRHADQAMYAAKQSGRNRYCFFTAEMRNAAIAHQGRIAELRNAIEKQQLSVLYEPVVALASGAIEGAEAQLFWNHPANGLLTAEHFAGLAEEAGVLDELRELVLTDALAHAAAWHGTNGAALNVSIELASLPVKAKGADPARIAILERIGKAAAPVALEITESMLLGEGPGGPELLQQLAASGVPLCIDGFGAGNSSLSSLTKCPLRGLRLDAHLVHDIEAAMPIALASGIIASAHALGVVVIAEGVATAAQQAQLIALGCDQAQGPHFHLPMDAATLGKLIGHAH